MNFSHLASDEVYRSARSIPEALMRQAWWWAQDRSKDPRTKVGAVVYDLRTGASFFGYNGFNPGMPDYKEVWDCRDPEAAINKYNFVRHAEANALTKAQQLLGNLEGCFLVVTHLPCPACMKDWVAPSGIKQVYFNDEHDSHPLTWIHARIHGIEMTHIVAAGVGKFYSSKLAEPYEAQPSGGKVEVDGEAETAKVARPSRDKKGLWVEQHAIDQMRARFPDDVSGEDSDIRRLIFGLFYNGSEVGERVVDTAFVRVAYFNSGKAVALSCKDEGTRYAVITVLYVEDLEETGLIRFPDKE